MSDPERFLSPGSDSSQLERELLGSVREVGPRGDAKERAWSGIVAGVAAATVVGASATASAGAAAAAGNVGSATAVSGIFAKVTLAVVLTGAAVGGGYWALRAPLVADAPRPVASAAAVLPASPQEVATAEPSALPEEPSVVVAQAPRASAKRAAVTSAEMLAAESALLMQARAQLRGGDAKSAQATLERLRSEFPSGVLQQEREVLAIELLAKRGDAAGAQQRAQRFIKAHPKSPHSEALRRFLQGS